MIRPAAQDAATPGPNLRATGEAQHDRAGVPPRSSSPPRTQERRPRARGGASSDQEAAANRSLPTVAVETHTPRPRLTDRLVHEAVTGRLSVVVVRVDADGKVGRRSFLTLAAAERARDRAIAAGGDAALVLCHMVPVEVHRADGDVHVPGRHEVVRDEHGRLVPNSRPGR